MYTSINGKFTKENFYEYTPVGILHPDEIGGILSRIRLGTPAPVLASGDASRKELAQVIRPAMKAWPATAEDSANG